MSLAIAEKRPKQGNGGCASIFFHFFSKKKLFSKKQLLPPVKNPSKNMAKLLLIADENRGGFTRLEIEPDPGLKNRMQAPSLVARLMGLESMPVVENEKPRKALDSKFCNDTSFEHLRIDQALCVDNANNKRVELRPQKLQKTRGGFLERRPVEALIYASRNRKKQYMKLETLVKTPRLISKSSTSRLVQVANKILDPGLLVGSRAKCAIAYIDSFEDGRGKNREHFSDFIDGSCKSCGSSLGESLDAECGSSASDLSNVSEDREKIKSPVFPTSGQKKNGSVTIPSKLKAEEGYKLKAPFGTGRQIKDGSLTIQSKPNNDGRYRDLMERKKHLGGIEDRCDKSILRKNSLRQNPLSPIRDKLVAGTKICSVKQTEKSFDESHKAKNFVALNKNLNNFTRSRLPTKVSGSYTAELERDSCEKNLARKRSPTNRTLETVNTNFVKERSVRSDIASTKGEFLITNHSVNNSIINSNLRNIDCDNFTGSNNNCIVSFTFSSPMRHESRSTSHRSTSHQEMSQEGKGQNEPRHNACKSKKFTSNAKIGSLSSGTGMAVRGDALSSLLEEKIRELSSLERDDLASRDDLQGRSTVSILEELISALTMRAPESHKNGDNCSDVSIRTDSNRSHNQMIHIDKEFQERALPDIPAAYLDGGGDQPSPVSILEASFSNESCSLGSHNESSGSKPQLQLSEMCNNSCSLDMDCDLLDSTSSFNVNPSFNNVARMHELGVSEAELATATEAISDAELLLENISLHWSDKKLESSFDSFLLDTLENIKPEKEGNHSREFLLDCIMECLDSKFNHFCRFGFRTWLKLSLILSRDQMMREIHVQIMGWRELAGKTLDDLVKNEMRGSHFGWTMCETKAFEMGVEIQSEILQTLIDEMVVDLC